MLQEQVKPFCDAVRQFVRDGEAGRHEASRLVAALARTGFDRADAFLIGAAVALTRGFPLPSTGAAAEIERLPDWRERALDALSVMFMFNVVNRVANAYDLMPEWERLTASGWRRTKLTELMSMGLPLLMPLESDAGGAEAEAPPLEPLIRQWGISQPSPMWKQFRIFPSVELAIYRLMWVSINYCETDE